MTHSDDFRAGLKYFSLAILPQLVLICVVFYGYISYRNLQIHSVLQVEEGMQVNNAYFQLTTRLEGVVSDLLILSKSESLTDYTRGEARAFNVAKTFTLFARERRIYDSIRYADGAGKEVVVINYDGQQPYLEWPKNLRNIAKSFVYERISSLKPGTIYISALTSSDTVYYQEPTMLVATPVYDRHGEYHGMVSLHLRGRVILDSVRQQRGDSPGLPMLVGNDGEILLSEVNQPLVGELFSSKYPQAWEQLQRSSMEQAFLPEGFFTHRRLTGKDIERSHSSSSVIVMERIDRVSGPEPYFFNLIGFIPQKTIAEYTAMSWFGYLVVIASMLFAALSSWLYTQMRLRQSASERHMRLVSHVEEVTRDGVVIYDEDQHIVSVNPAFSIQTGYLPHEVIGKEAAAFRSEGDEGEAEESLLTSALRKDNAVREVNCKNKKGTEFPIASTVTVMRRHDGSVENYIEIFSDIGYLKRKENLLLRQAYYDALTGVPNRLLFEDRLRVVIKNSQRRHEKFALMFIDVNDFKNINDRYGHETGDKVLVGIADRLAKAVRESDTVARLGGDEFVVIANNIQDREAADTLATKLEEVTAEPIKIDHDVSISVSISIGSSLYPDDGESESGLTKVADLAMYRQKAKKKSSAMMRRVTQDM